MEKKKKKKERKLGIVAYACHPSYSKKLKI
jgi:hypothetical protein